MATRNRITIGATAGHHFRGQADLHVVSHCVSGDRRGYYHVRKWLSDRMAFDYDARLGWAYDRWFEWLDTGEPAG